MLAVALLLLTFSPITIDAPIETGQFAVLLAGFVVLVALNLLLGHGMPPRLPSGTAGISGMGERALLVDGRLSIASRPDQGTEVRLSIPLGEEEPVTVPLKTRILLADDHEVVRDGLRMVLDSAPDLAVVAQAGDGAKAVELALPRTWTSQCST